MKNFLIHLALVCSISQVLALDSYNSNNGQLTIPLVDVNGITYTNVIVTVGQVLSVGSAPANGNNDVFNSSNGQLIIPSVTVGSNTYYNIIATVSTVLSVGQTMPTGTTIVLYNVSPTPDLSSLGLPTTPYYFQYNNVTYTSTYLSNVLGAAPSGVVFTKGQDKLNHAFVFPSYDNNSNYLNSVGPNIPTIEFIESTPNKFTVKNIIKEIGLGVARSWALINTNKSNINEFIVVDHGLEPGKLPMSSWPFGYVWDAKDTGAGFQFNKVSSSAQFNHSVAVGDLNGDGLDDIVVSNMGNRINCQINSNLEYYLQENQSTFNNDLTCLNDNIASNGSGAIAIADVLNTGSNQVIQVNYSPNGANDWGAIRVLTGNKIQTSKVLYTISRQGLFTSMGATQVIPFDYDKDGKLDLLISLEGGGKNGIEIYRNLGAGNFQFVTSQLLETNLWSSNDLQFRECQVTDLNGDGYPDIVIQGWNGSKFKYSQTPQIDIGQLVLINQNGKSFKSISGTASTIVSVESWTKSPQYLRYLDTDLKSGFSRLWGVRGDGTPVTISFKP